MKRVLWLLVVGAFGFSGVGCSNDSAPKKPETFAPLPSAAPGGTGSTQKIDPKKDNNKAQAMQPES